MWLSLRSEFHVSKTNTKCYQYFYCCRYLFQQCNPNACVCLCHNYFTAVSKLVCTRIKIIFASPLTFMNYLITTFLSKMRCCDRNLFKFLIYRHFFLWWKFWNAEGGLRLGIVSCRSQSAFSARCFQLLVAVCQIWM